MQSNIVLGIFLVLIIAITGGVVVKFLRLQPIVGYIISGIVFGSFFFIKGSEVPKLAEIGSILLLFSIGLELSLTRLKRIFKVAIVGGILQIVLTSLILYLILSQLGFDAKVSFIFSCAFSLSSTALVVKTLFDRGEMETIHGELMIGWLLVQDLVVIPIMIILPLLTKTSGGWLELTIVALLKVITVIISVVFFGRIIAPFFIHKIASINSRELLVISAVALALGTALLTSVFGISGALGAFLAGIVISETQENHAIFAETRPLRDLFVALFFVSLGMLIKFSTFIENFWFIILLVLLLLLIKFLVLLFISFAFGYKGKTPFQASLGLTQVGEFSFVIFSSARGFNLLSQDQASFGILIALTSIIISPLLFKLSVPLWRRLSKLSVDYPMISKLLNGYNKRLNYKINEYKNHIIICGYGRVGSWIGKALEILNTPFVVIDYNQAIIQQAKNAGIETIYGDPSQIEVLTQAGIERAKAIVVAIPDRIAQEELIAKVQTQYPQVKIYARAHFDEDFERLKFLRIKKVVQPEFEAALAIVKSILLSQGKDNKQILEMIKSLRQSKALKKI